MRTLRVSSGVVAGVFWLLAGVGVVYAASAEDGKKIFDTRKCINCHTLGDQKGPMAKSGGPLDGVGGKRDAAWLKAYLTDPKSKVSDAKMPKLKYTDAEMDAIIQYMLSLK
jgi:mono/diheme cytochrome c family protein